MYTLTINCKDIKMLMAATAMVKWLEDKHWDIEKKPTDEEILKAAKKPVKVSVPETEAVEILKEVIEPIIKKAIQIENEADKAEDFTAVKKVILELAQIKGRNASLNVLKQFPNSQGNPCERITELKPEQYPGVLKTAREALL